MKPSPNACQSTPSWRPIFSSPTFQSPDLMNCTTATFQPRATPRIIIPNADDDLPLPLPVLTQDERVGAAQPVGAGVVGGDGGCLFGVLVAVVGGIVVGHELGERTHTAVRCRTVADAAKSGEIPALSRNGGSPV